jgi:cytoskeletal protein RodZ
MICYILFGIFKQDKKNTEEKYKKKMTLKKKEKHKKKKHLIMYIVRIHWIP